MAAAPPPVFSLTPGTAINGVLNWGTKEAREMYNNAIKPLGEELYDCKPEGFYQFMQALDTRAANYGWSDDVQGVLWIPEDPAQPMANLRYIVEEYGTLSMEAIEAHEETYIDTPTRAAQDNRMIYNCLMNSINTEAKKKITIWRDQYTINGEFSGILLLKVLIRESHLDTNATVTMIRTRLSNLDTYIQTIGNDITKFNGYVRVLVDGLSARREVTNDLLTHLFKGYAACSDQKFVEYIGRKQEQYEEGEDVTAEDLMTLADTKYRQLKDKGQWEAPSPEEEKILALEAKLKKLEKTTNKKQTPKPDGKKRSAKGEGTKERPKWMSQKPKPEDLKKPREWNGKKWFWCSPETGGKCEGHYRVHHPSKCEGKAFKPKKPIDNPNPKRVKMADALETIIKEKGDEYESDDTRF